MEGGEKEEVMTSQVLGWNSWMDRGAVSRDERKGFGKKTVHSVLDEF